MVMQNDKNISQNYWPVKQGDILFISFDPSQDHEQQKNRPALVVSNNQFNMNSSIIWLCPISPANNYPLHISFPSGLTTTGKVLCDQIRSMDIRARGYKYVESVPLSFINTKNKPTKDCGSF